MKCLVCDFILETICSSMIFFFFIRILFMIYCYTIVKSLQCDFLFYDLCMYRNTCILRCISVHVINELDFTCFVGMESESEFTGKYSELS